MVAKVFAVLALAVLSVCSANPTNRVVGGKDAKVGQFPYQISLRFSKSHICGGSIVAERFILTAAHCVVEEGTTAYAPENFSIRAGSINRLSGGVVRDVKKIVVHEDYANFLNDLAVLELTEPLEYSDVIKPIDLDDDSVPTGSKIIISGWGLTENKGDSLPAILQYNELEAISKLSCVSQTGFYSDALLCLGHEADNGACNGDSGGPAAYDGKLAGVAGFVVTGCGSSRADGYAKVSYNIDWIREHIK